MVNEHTHLEAEEEYPLSERHYIFFSYISYFMYLFLPEKKHKNSQVIIVTKLMLNLQAGQGESERQ